MIKSKYLSYFMDVAERTAQLSYAKRLKVGTVIVKNNRIISCGYNGLPAGWEPNDCERLITLDYNQYTGLPEAEKSRYTKIVKEGGFSEESPYTDFREYFVWQGLKTYDEVVHSEANAIGQLASSTESGIGAILVCTHSPCLQCSKIIYSSGIQAVYYKNEYRSNDGIQFLKKCGVEVTKYGEK